ncbi:MAG: PIN domain-containing protein [Acidobacteria bacterium]|nr:MAG: PIN domain-containing protein [Acidobacteriota bacterium]
MSDRLLLDTVYVEALLSPRDQHHEKALELFPKVEAAAMVFITEAVLLEIGNGSAGVNARQEAAKFIDGCYERTDPNFTVVPLDSQLIRRSLDLFSRSSDKTWSLTDCISFVVMEENQIEQAVTTDKHFVQKGFRALMRED